MTSLSLLSLLNPATLPMEPAFTQYTVRGRVGHTASFLRPGYATGGGRADQAAGKLAATICEAVTAERRAREYARDPVNCVAHHRWMPETKKVAA